MHTFLGSGKIFTKLSALIIWKVDHMPTKLPVLEKELVLGQNVNTYQWFLEAGCKAL